MLQYYDEFNIFKYIRLLFLWNLISLISPLVKFILCWLIGVYFCGKTLSYELTSICKANKKILGGLITAIRQNLNLEFNILFGKSLLCNVSSFSGSLTRICITCVGLNMNNVFLIFTNIKYHFIKIQIPAARKRKTTEKKSLIKRHKIK